MQEKRSENAKIKLGIIGYGNLGQFIHQKASITPFDDLFSPSFIWNRSSAKLEKCNIPSSLRLQEKPLPEALRAWLENNPVDIIVEAAHPDIVKDTYDLVTEKTVYYITSLTAFTDPVMEARVKEDLASKRLFIPTGAGWGFSDIRKMGLLNQLQAIHVEMTFHPDALKLSGKYRDNLLNYVSSTRELENPGKHLVAEGTIRQLGNIAPNNCNTMLGLALSTGMTGALDDFKGTLWADASNHTHLVRIKVSGPAGFEVETIRRNPANPGAVTGSMTFQSFWGDLVMLAETLREESKGD